jgi:hypothetical protein
MTFVRASASTLSLITSLKEFRTQFYALHKGHLPEDLCDELDDLSVPLAILEEMNDVFAKVSNVVPLSAKEALRRCNFRCEKMKDCVKSLNL